MKKFLKEMFRGTGGDISSKRTITLFAFLFLCIAFISNMVFGTVVSEFMFENLTYIVLAGLGMTTMEPLALSYKGRDTSSSSTSTTTTTIEEDREENVS